MATRIRSRCPHCNQTLKVDESLIGRNVRCPRCEERFVLSSVLLSGDASTAVSVEKTESLQNTGSVENKGASGDGGNGEPSSASSRYRSDSEPTMGRTGRFEWKALLGHGGFGRVYRAYDPQLDRQLALKVPKFAPEDRKKIRRFLTEAKAAATLRHPNIVAVFECGQAEGEYYIASEYVEGRTLADCIRRARPGFREAAEWVRQLADALAYAHEEGIVHRDIKPDNVMIGAHNRPQIMDFGLAKLLDEDSSMTAEGGVLGTPAYMSPEQARGDVAQVGPHSDQYSVGVVLYELLTGQKPFDGPPHSVVAKVAQEEPPPPQKLNAEVPSDLQAICLKAMEKDPQQRYADLAKMAEDLDRWLSGHETLARPVGPVERARRWCRRNPVVAGLSSALLLALVVGMMISVYFAVAAGHAKRIAEQERDAARAAEQSAIEATERELAAQQLATVRLAENDRDHGLRYLEEGHRAEGVHSLVRSIQEAPEGADDLIRSARLNLAAIRPLVESRRVFVQHTGWVLDVDISPDGKRVATGDQTGVIRVWDLATGLAVTPPLRHDHGTRNDWIRSVAFSPDGKTLVSTGNDETVRLWDSTSGQLLANVNLHQEITAAVFHPDGKTVLTGQWSGVLQLRDSRNLEPLGKPFQASSPVSIGKIAVSGDGKVVATSGKLRVWDATTQQAMPQQPPIKPWASCVAVSPDGRRVAWGTGWGQVQLWDVAEGRFISQLRGHDKKIHRIAFSPDGQRFVTAGADMTVRFWDTETGAELGPVLRHSAGLSGLALSPDGRFLVTGDTIGRCQVWDLEVQPGAAQTLDHGAAITAVAVSHAGDRAVTASADSVRVWNVADHEAVRRLSPGVPSGGGVVFSPDDRFLLADVGKEVRVWSLEADGDTAMTVPHPNGVYDFDFSSDGRFVATAGSDQLVRVWDLATGELRVPPLQHPMRVWAVAFREDSQGGNELFSLTAEDATVRHWDLDSGALIGEPQRLSASVRWPVKFSPDGGMLSLTDVTDGTSLWQWNGSAWADPLPLHDKAVENGIAYFSTDGTQLLLSGDSDVTAWDVASQKTVGRRVLNLKGGVAISWADKLGYVVVLHEDGGCRLWDTRAGRPIIAPHPDSGATSVAIDPAGRIVVVGDSQGKAHLWPVPKPLDWPVERLKLWAETMTGTELAPDGTFRSLGHEQWYGRLQQLRAP